MIRVIVNGANGRMGRELVRLIKDRADFVVTAEVDLGGGQYTRLADVKEEADLVIDFSSPAAALDVADFINKRQLPAVICTTGHNELQLEAIKSASCAAPVFMSANMSVGVSLLINLAKQAALLFPEADIEIVEVHHNRKEDAPSGTALMMAEGIKSVLPESKLVCGRSGQGKREAGEIGISSIRMGNVIGEHEVFFTTPTQTVSLKHVSRDRALFADGALTAAKYIIKQKPGFYGMKDLLG